MRSKGAENKTKKYNCLITFMGNEVLNRDYTTLKKLSDDIEVPYHTITDIYEGRRTAYKKFNGTKYFPDFVISRIEILEEVSGN